MAVKFNQEYFDKLRNYAVLALFKAWSVKAPAPVNAEYNVYDILHVVALGTLQNILKRIKKDIEAAEAEDEWVSTEKDQKRLEQLKFSRELVNLSIGYRRFKMEEESLEKERIAAKKELDALKEAAKTPEEKIREAEARLAKLNEVPSFLKEGPSEDSSENPSENSSESNS